MWCPGYAILASRLYGCAALLRTIVLPTAVDAMAGMGLAANVNEGIRSHASRTKRAWSFSSTAATDGRTARHSLSLESTWALSVSHAVDSDGRLERRNLDAQCGCRVADDLPHRLTDHDCLGAGGYQLASVSRRAARGGTRRYRGPAPAVALDARLDARQCGRAGDPDTRWGHYPVGLVDTDLCPRPGRSDECTSLASHRPRPRPTLRTLGSRGTQRHELQPGPRRRPCPGWSHHRCRRHSGGLSAQCCLIS